MKYIFLICSIGFLSFSLMGEGISEAADNGTEKLQKGVESFNTGNIQEAISLFAEASNSGNDKIAASAYYNHGTALAKASDSIEDSSKVQPMLESAYQSIKRACLLDALSKENMVRARRNMQLIREKLLQLQNESNQKENSKDHKSEESMNDENSKDNTEKNDDGQKSQKQNSNSDMNKEQQDNNMQSSGDQETESSSESMEEKEMNDILNQESKNMQVRQILESKGGISNVDKDW